MPSPPPCPETGLWFYRTIFGFPGYFVHYDGFVIRGVQLAEIEGFADTIIRFARPLKPDNCNGYLRVHLKDTTGTRRWRPIHTLVLEAFVGPRPSPLHHGAHKDGDKNHNSFDNLAWKLPVHNEADKKLHGTAPRGGARRRTHRVRRRAIQKRVAAGESFTTVAKRFKMHRSAVAKIVKGRRNG